MNLFILSSLIEPAVGLIFWTTITFILLLVLLGKFAWKPILNAIKIREKSIEDALASAESALRDMRELRTNNEKILAEALEAAYGKGSINLEKGEFTPYEEEAEVVE
jgi:F0F1-type ATP synthase membrane subunit b/b'